MFSFSSFTILRDSFTLSSISLMCLKRLWLFFLKSIFLKFVLFLFMLLFSCHLTFLSWFSFLHHSRYVSSHGDLAYRIVSSLFSYCSQLSAVLELGVDLFNIIPYWDMVFVNDCWILSTLNLYGVWLHASAGHLSSDGREDEKMVWAIIGGLVGYAMFFVCFPFFLWK